MPSPSPSVQERAAREVCSLISEGYRRIGETDGIITLRHTRNRNRATIVMWDDCAWLAINGRLKKWL